MYCKKEYSVMRTGLATSLFLVLAPSVALGAITPSLVASRISGPAPLAVHLDASGTTIDDASVNTFGDLGYRFNFGDAGSGTWAYSGKLKNEQIGGPIAAHVYTTPGVYEVKLEVGSKGGGRATKTIQVTVRSADSDFGADKSVCISTTASMVGCPEGATQRPNATSWGTFTNATRYLLASGQDFQPLGNLIVNCSSCQFTKFGDGGKPRVKKIIYGSKPAYPPRGAVEFYGLSAEAVEVAFGENITIYGNDLQPATSVGGAVNVGSTVNYFYQNPGTLDPTKIGWPKNIFVIENQINGAAPNAVCGIWALANNLSVVGNDIRNPKEHDIRIALARKAFVAHNRLVAGANETKHQIKFHSSGLQDWTTGYIADTPTPSSSMSVISSNMIGEGAGDQNTWNIVLGPQNAQSTEGHKLEVIEDNRFVYNSASPAYQNQIIMTGINMWERGNKFENKKDSITVGTTGQTAAMPPGWDGPVSVGGQSVSEWMTSPGSAPPAAVQLQVE